MDNQETLDLLLEQIAEEVITSKIKPFNQPNLIAISSANRNAEGFNENLLNESGFYNFSVSLPIPAVAMKSLQLLSTNIPQSNANIPNTASVFWYYRLSEYSGMLPSIENLHYVRLLPTTYKQEYIANSSVYGYNKTFNNYTTVSTELAKACETDLLLTNYNDLHNLDPLDFPLNKYIPFLPNDVSVFYDPAINKFKMTGLNTQVAYRVYDSATLYALGDIIVNEDGNRAYENIYTCRGVAPPTPNATGLPDWVSGTAYLVGNVVVDVNKIVYECILDITIPADKLKPPYQLLTHYKSIGYSLTPITQYQLWTVGVNYALGNSVLYGNTVYVLYQNGEDQTNPPPLQPLHFKALPTYVNRNYFWERKYIEIVEYWDATTPYSAGMIVSYNNQTFKSNTANTNQIPAGSSYWTPTTITTWYSYLVTGYDDPNVKKLQGELFLIDWEATRTYNTGDLTNYNGVGIVAKKQSINRLPNDIIVAPDWSATETYTPGMSVYYNDVAYECKGLNYGLQPNLPIPDFIFNTPYVLNQIVRIGGGYNYRCILSYAGGTLTPNSDLTHWVSDIYGTTANYWEVLASSTFWGFADSTYKTGLYGLTKQYDMIEFNPAQTGVRVNYPYGVGGQPYNPEPKRLLNSILGFTWNGLFNPVDFLNISSDTLNILISTKFPLLYNRLRPVPDYVVISPFPSGLFSENATTTTSTTLTFTADSYANLVYSSVLSIYADVVGASSVDTQRTSKLLAITSMNCGNLGVAFWNNYIDNPLMKVSGDIYTIYIEFRDEFGDPYYLSNNAVATMSFKASY